VRSDCLLREALTSTTLSPTVQAVHDAFWWVLGLIHDYRRLLLLFRREAASGSHGSPEAKLCWCEKPLKASVATTEPRARYDELVDVLNGVVSTIPYGLPGLLH